MGEVGAFKPSTWGREPLVLAGVVVIGLLLCSACTERADAIRPEGVPREATYVAGGKVGGWWQMCAPDVAGRGPHCSIWNRVGTKLWDEEFLPYDQGSLPAPDEIKIPTDGWLAGADRVCLETRRVLFPKSRFEELKRWLNGPRRKELTTWDESRDEPLRCSARPKLVLPILYVGDALLVGVRDAREAVDALQDLSDQNLVLLLQGLISQQSFLVPLMCFLALELHPSDDLNGLRQGFVALVPCDPFFRRNSSFTSVARAGLFSARVYFAASFTLPSGLYFAAIFGGFFRLLYTASTNMSVVHGPCSRRSACRNRQRKRAAFTLQRGALL